MDERRVSRADADNMVYGWFCPAVLTKSRGLIAPPMLSTTDIPPLIQSLRFAPRRASGGCRYPLRQFLAFSLFVADRSEHTCRRRHLDREPSL